LIGERRLYCVKVAGASDVFLAIIAGARHGS
jgi:hypothetical protein